MQKLINNQLLLSFWGYRRFGQQDTKSTVEMWKDAGFNTVLSFIYPKDYQKPSDMIELLDLCAENNLKVILYDDRIHCHRLQEMSEDEYEKAVIRSVKEFGNHPAAVAFFVSDEPNKDTLPLAEKAVQQGFKTIVLQSGEDLFFTTHKICSILREIKKMDVAITLSIGEKTADEYKAYKEAGADRFLLRIETTDKNLYHYLDPDMSWETRKQCLLDLKNAGYELGSGIMVGLPNQTIDSIADDLLFLKEIGIDMAGIGPFIPAQGTPLENEVGKDLYLALRTMALMRLLMPKINIPATTAMEALHPMGRLMALKAGANVVMANITTEEYARLYQLYPGKESVDQSDIAQKILSIGRSIGLGYGTSKQFKKI